MKNRKWFPLYLGVFLFFIIWFRFELQRLGFWGGFAVLSLNIFFIIGYLGLYLFRDVSRVTAPLQFSYIIFVIASMLPFLDLTGNNIYRVKRTLIDLVFLAASLYVAIPETLKARYFILFKSPTFETRVQAYRQLVQPYEGRVKIPSLGLPLRRPRGLYIFRSFQENDFVGDFYTNNFFPVGWQARHPFYYDQLKRQGISTFYELLIKDGTLILGGVPAKKELLENWLRYLDESYANEGEHHEFRVIKKVGKLGLGELILRWN